MTKEALAVSAHTQDSGKAGGGEENVGATVIIPVVATVTVCIAFWAVSIWFGKLVSDIIF